MENKNLHVLLSQQEHKICSDFKIEFNNGKCDLTGDLTGLTFPWIA